MYRNYRDHMVEGTESFPVGWIVGENLLYVLGWGIAGFLLWPLWLFAGVHVFTIGWVVLVLAVQILLKKHNCSGCYYYGKRCHLGWGKLASLMFSQDSGSADVGKVLSLFYVVTPPLILIVAVIFGAFCRPQSYYWVAIGLYVILNLAAFPVRVAGCRACAVREVCLGSAAKA
jgi:hypothetical protein